MGQCKCNELRLEKVFLKPVELNKFDVCCMLYNKTL